MLIQHSQIGLQSQHTRTQLESSRERLEMWVGTRGTNGRARAQATAPLAQPVPRPPVAPPPDVAKTERTQPGRDSLEPRMQTLVRMIEAITGMPVRLGHLDDLADGQAPAADLPVPAAPAVAAQGNAPAGWGLVYERETTQVDTESLAIEAQGRVVTADGTEISFSLKVQMQSTRISTSSTSLRAGDAVLKDPLVIHFDGPLGELRDSRFTFDLDADGRPDAMPFVGQGSGFLVLDRNANGKVDNGRELFGAISGNGFADLTTFDDDQNGWIDEADAVFERLQVWRMDGAGTTRLQGLSEAGVGALSLGTVSTDVALRASATGPQLGQLRSTGLYLSHSGQAGLVQQIDLAV